MGRGTGLVTCFASKFRIWRGLTWISWAHNVVLMFSWCWQTVCDGRRVLIKQTSVLHWKNRRVAVLYFAAFTHLQPLKKDSSPVCLCLNFTHFSGAKNHWMGIYNEPKKTSEKGNVWCKHHSMKVHASPANTTHPPNVGPMLVHRLRRRPYIGLTLSRCFALAWWDDWRGTYQQTRDTKPMLF